MTSIVALTSLARRILQHQGVELADHGQVVRKVTVIQIPRTLNAVILCGAKRVMLRAA
ncbi:MAG: hypothetical protein FWD63_04415 [Propionibacteriaceae bacterium]|nr:hypothetical protein [Propionibacteriaceae bacterium]